jgi:hypothetical protein
MSFEKTSNIKFHENPSCASRGVTFRRTDRQTDRQTDTSKIIRFSKFCERAVSADTHTQYLHTGETVTSHHWLFYILLAISEVTRFAEGLTFILLQNWIFSFLICIYVSHVPKLPHYLTHMYRVIRNLSDLWINRIGHTTSTGVHVCVCVCWCVYAWVVVFVCACVTHDYQHSIAL